MQELNTGSCSAAARADSREVFPDKNVWLAVFASDVPARLHPAPRRQHAVPVDLRQQRRGPLRSHRLHALLLRRGRRRDGCALPGRLRVDAAGHRGVRHDRGRDGRVPGPVAARAGVDGHRPAVLLARVSARRGAARDLVRVTVRDEFNPNSGVAWLAHVGGFVAGAGIALALRGLFGPPRRRVRPAEPPQWGWGR